MGGDPIDSEAQELVDGLSHLSGLGISVEGPALTSARQHPCAARPDCADTRSARDADRPCSRTDGDAGCPRQADGPPVCVRRHLTGLGSWLACVTVCGGPEVPSETLASWADLVSHAFEAILRRELELNLTARELSLAYSELDLIYELGGMLNHGGSETELTLAVLDHLSGVVAFDAAALLSSDSEAGFLRLVSAHSADEALLGAMTSAAHRASREGLLPAATTGLVVPARDLGVQGLDGELLLAATHGEDLTTDLLVVAREDPTDSFTSGQVKLVCATVQGMALALAAARLREGLTSLFLSTIRALAAAVDAKDPYTRGHSQRVATLSMSVGREMGLSGRQLEDLQLAALLHDVGKIGVSTEVLTKPSALDEREWSMVKSHPVHGAEILLCVPQLAPIVHAVRYHHEHFDGSGYPEGLTGENIPEAARLIGVCDAYDAMTSARPYRGPMTPEAALDDLERSAGVKFDPTIVKALVRVVRSETNDLEYLQAA